METLFSSENMLLQIDCMALMYNSEEKKQVEKEGHTIRVKTGLPRSELLKPFTIPFCQKIL